MENNTEIDIKEWIKSNIIVDRFPVAKELQKGGKHHKVDVVINVSDEFFLGNTRLMMQEGKINFFFPLGEEKNGMHLSSLYGALYVLHEIYEFNPEWYILLHCQAGRNRSPVVKQAFHYMMTNEHLFTYTDEDNTETNQLLANCRKEVLPKQEIVEKFLQNCKEALDNQHKFLGGIFDWIIKQTYK